MWVVKKANKGAATMTLEASILTLKARIMATISEKPSNATADE